MKCSLDISNFLKEISSLSYSFFSISLHCSLKKTFLLPCAILWTSAFSWIYFSLSSLPFTSLLFSGVYKASSDNQFAFLDFFLFWMVWVTVSCTMLRISAHSSSGTLSTRSNPLNLFITSRFNLMFSSRRVRLW